MRKRHIGAAIFVLSLALFGIEQLTAPPISLPQSPKKPDVSLPTQTANQLYPVTKVIDGDTIDISINGTKTRIRMIGVDTPEISDPRKPVQCFGREASKVTRNLLENKTVSIETDPSQHLYDTYGRLLAYVYVSDGTLINKYLIEEGYAHEYTYKLPYKYQNEFKAAQARARTALKGLWSPQTCNGDTQKTVPTR